MTEEKTVKNMIEELVVISEAFKIPIAKKNQHIWFLRTQAGTYYFDFYINNYVALGWNDIPIGLIKDEKTSYQKKKERVEEIYPEEMRPGLILGQMETFYNKMSAGDLIIIPAVSGKRIAIGILGEISTTVNHAISDNDYSRCEYKHMRSVKWQKEIEDWNDIYLFRALRAQQTISDITEYADMVYRNLYACYIDEDAVHLMLQKISSADYSVTDNVSLLASILDISNMLAEIYGAQSETEKITYRTAVGSPGFLEIILPCIPVSAISVVFIIKALIGSIKSKDGQSASGIMAIITKINELINDHANRKKTYAEIAQIEAVTKKTDAETTAIAASVEKTIAETEAIKIANKKAEIQLHDDIARAKVGNIADSCATIHKSAKNSGIRYNGKIEEAS